VTRINDLNTTLGLTTQAIKASLDSSGHLTFEAVNGGRLNVKFTSNTGTTAADQTEANVLGFGTVSKSLQNGASTSSTTQELTVLATNAITSKGLYTSANTLAQASSLLSALTDSTGAGITTLGNSSDSLTLTVGGKTSANLLGANATTQTIQGFIDTINHDTNIDSLVSASFDATTGKISITPLSSSATDASLVFTGVAASQKFNVGFGTSTLTTAAAANAKAGEDIYFGAAAGTLATLQTQYNTTLTQIDSLVGDTGYAGTNLLNGNNLTTYFNENRTSSLTTSGATFNSAGLGLTAGNFQNSSSISTAINQTIAALTTVRNFGSTLANNLSIIQNRQDFTNNLINTLKTGSDALTNADQNEEGASLLALQTRQSLGITSLSLASQAQQAILKLF
ncbi:MAG TPA: hypothetical protein V6C72_00460, partial [Chroococcales cyanobacterium]